MLTAVTIKNLRNPAETRLAGLHALNVIAGQGGSGKTTLLEATQLVHRVGTVAPANLFPTGSSRGPVLMDRSGQRDSPIAGKSMLRRLGGVNNAGTGLDAERWAHKYVRAA